MGVKDLKRKHANAWQVKREKQNRRKQMQLQDLVMVIGKKQIEVEELLAENYNLKVRLQGYEMAAPALVINQEAPKLELIEGGKSAVTATEGAPA